MDTITASTMAKRVLASALVGVLAGAFPIDPINLALYQRYVIHNDVWFSMELSEAIKISLERAPFIAIFGLVIASPLIAIAVATGIACRRLIIRHPLLWATTAPALVWLFTCTVFALPRDNPWSEQHGYVDRLINAMKGIDNTLFFFAPAAAALCFVFLTYRAARSVA